MAQIWPHGCLVAAILLVVPHSSYADFGDDSFQPVANTGAQAQYHQMAMGGCGSSGCGSLLPPSMGSAGCAGNDCTKGGVALNSAPSHGCNGGCCGSGCDMILERAHVIGVSEPAKSGGGTIVSRTYKPGPQGSRQEIIHNPGEIPGTPQVVRKMVMVQVPIEVERVVVPPPVKRGSQQVIDHPQRQSEPWSYGYKETHLIKSSPNNLVDAMQYNSCCGGSCCNGGCCQGRK
ncbi:hypothetical protein HDE_04051 [Halotydeus destructor]|nr:hypothetical protein HDE_04051 [Halotydeus destructor]